MTSICGIDCAACEWVSDCCGCAQTDGRPFGGECIVASCCRRGDGALEALKKSLIAAIRALSIEDMEEITELHALRGAFVNLSYPLPGGQTAAFWDDNKIYFGNQLHKRGSDRCYGVVADERYLLVAEYGDGGSQPEIVIFKRWN